MEFGLLVSPGGLAEATTRKDRVGGAADSLEDVLTPFKRMDELVEIADDIGFARVGFIEHHFVKINSTAPLISAARTAARTKNVRVSTDVILTAYHHPLVLAEQIAQVDNMTEGRLDTGFGKGSSGFEATRVGMSGILEAGERQNEALEILLGVWGTEEEFSYEGKYYKIPPVLVMPRPYQKPHPPMWMAARSSTSMRFCVEHGLGIHTTAQSEPMSNVYDQLKLLDAIVADLGAPGRPRLGAIRDLFISEDPKEIRAYCEKVAAEERLVRKTGFSDSTLREQVVLGKTAFDSSAQDRAAEDEITPEVIAERFIVGTPDVVIRRLREYEALGFDEYSLSFSSISHEQALRGMQLIGKYVIPEFRDRPIAPKVQSVNYGPLSKKATRDAELDAAIAAGYGLGPDWHEWETKSWVAHVDRAVAAGDPRHVYVFDFPNDPKVKADVTGFIDQAGKLQRVFGESCPECARPVIVLFNRRSGEGPGAMHDEIKRVLREGDWHAGRHVALASLARAGAR